MQKPKGAHTAVDTCFTAAPGMLLGLGGGGGGGGGGGCFMPHVAAAWGVSRSAPRLMKQNQRAMASSHSQTFRL
jgi:hypothetical protein